MIKKIFFILFISSFVYLSAYEFKLNKMQEDYLSKNKPELLETYKEIKSKINNDEKEFAIFLFTSSSVPVEYSTIYAKSLYNIRTKNIKHGVFFRGLNRNTYNYIQRSNEKIKKLHFKEPVEISYMFDPDFFKNNNLNKVPALSFSLCDFNNCYPSECKTLYLIRGTADVEFFINKIKERDENLGMLLEE